MGLAPARTGPAPMRGLLPGTADVARRIAGQRWTAAVMLALFVASRAIVAVIFVSQAAWILAGHQAQPGQERGALLAGAVLRTVEAVLATVGAVRWRSERRSAIAWLTAAVYVNLFVTQLFNFTDSQFAALAELPFLLLMLGFLGHHRRARTSSNRPVALSTPDK